MEKKEVNVRMFGRKKNRDAWQLIEFRKRGKGKRQESGI